MKKKTFGGLDDDSPNPDKMVVLLWVVVSAFQMDRLHSFTAHTFTSTKAVSKLACWNT